MRRHRGRSREIRDWRKPKHARAAACELLSLAPPPPDHAKQGTSSMPALLLSHLQETLADAHMSRCKLKDTVSVSGFAKAMVNTLNASRTEVTPYLLGAQSGLPGLPFRGLCPVDRIILLQLHRLHLLLDGLHLGWCSLRLGSLRTERSGELGPLVENALGRLESGRRGKIVPRGLSPGAAASAPRRRPPTSRGSSFLPLGLLGCPCQIWHAAGAPSETECAFCRPPPVGSACCCCCLLLLVARTHTPRARGPNTATTGRQPPAAPRPRARRNLVLPPLPRHGINDRPTDRPTAV